jgi:type I restriction enzyme, S subunit
VSFGRYATLENTKISWIGEIPRSWRVSSIKRDAYLKARVGWKGLTSDEYLDAGFAYLVTGTDFSGKFINWKDCHCVDERRYADDAFIQLRNGDLLITKDGSIGKLALVSNLDRPACLNSGIFLLRPSPAVRAEFLYWVLQSKCFFEFCELSSLGSTIQHLYQSVFERFFFPLPSYEEQASIAGFLDRETATIDALVAEQEELIALLEEKRQAVVSHAVTKGLNPEVQLHDSGIQWLGHVPAHWTRCQLGRVCRSVSDGPHFSPTYVDEGVMFLSARNIRVDGWSLDDVKFISESDYNEFCRRVVPERGDVLYTKGGTTGVARVVDLDERFQVWVHVAVLKVDRGLADPHYLAYALNSVGGYEQAQLLTRGATNNDLGLTRMVKIWLALPPLNEQRRIVSFLDQKLAGLDGLVQNVCRATDLLKERRSALISAAVTGQIDVRDLVMDSEAGRVADWKRGLAGEPLF